MLCCGIEYCAPVQNAEIIQRTECQRVRETAAYARKGASAAGLRKRRGEGAGTHVDLSTRRSTYISLQYAAPAVWFRFLSEEGQRREEEKESQTVFVEKLGKGNARHAATKTI